jgi:hypothetical protein
VSREQQVKQPTVKPAGALGYVAKPLTDRVRPRDGQGPAARRTGQGTARSIAVTLQKKPILLRDRLV